MAAKREVVLIREGCRVIWKGPLSKGSAMHVLYAGEILPATEGGSPVCDLYDERGYRMYEKCSLGDMWHVSATHKNCKGEKADVKL